MTSPDNITEADDVTKGGGGGGGATSALYDITRGDDLNGAGEGSSLGAMGVTSYSNSSILKALSNLLTTEDTLLNHSATSPSSSLLAGAEETTAPPSAEAKGGLSDMEKWFLVTACLIGACLILMVVNALLHYKETVMTELRKRHIGRKRVRRDGLNYEGEERRDYQTHVFYHPFTSNRGQDDRRSADSHSNHL